MEGLIKNGQDKIASQCCPDWIKSSLNWLTQLHWLTSYLKRTNYLATSVSYPFWQMKVEKNIKKIKKDQNIKKLKISSSRYSVLAPLKGAPNIQKNIFRLLHYYIKNS